MTTDYSKDINFSPFATNILDMLEVPLVDHNGRDVIIRSVGTGFVVAIDGLKKFESWDNIEVSYFLNTLGVTRKE
jgi:hypothetical protein